MNIVLSKRVLDIVGFFVVLPVLVELVDLARHVPLFLGIKSLKQADYIKLLLFYWTM